MKIHGWSLFVIVAGIGTALIACGSDGSSSDGPPTSAQEPTDPFAGNGGGKGTSTTTQSAESCTSAGSTRSCCTTGTQTCTGSGELTTWGDCADKAGAPLKCESPPKVEAGVKGDAGADSAPPTQSATCGAGMACKPGSVRFCDSKIAEWTKSTCDAAGQWGPCVETTAPNGPKCDPDSYSPEKCCPGLKLCCQDNSNGPFVDFGSGACAEINCPGK